MNGINTPIRVLHVVSGLEPEQGGPAYTVPRLCKALVAAGVSTQIYSVASQAEPERCEGDASSFRWNFASVPFLKNLRISRSLIRKLNNLNGQFDFVHVHGLWTLACVFGSKAAEKVGIPLVLAPRGMLSPGSLRISPLKKAVFWHLHQHRAVRASTCIHATSQLEADEIAGFLNRWNMRIPVAIVGNGVDIPVLPPRPLRGDERTMLFLGRLHRKKGLVTVVRAWSRLAAERPKWHLRIVGPDEHGHAAELRQMASALGVPRISIEGPKFGADKWDAYRSSDLYVLPSHAENFAVTVAEALAAEVPVITTKNTPWSRITAENCGWWIDEGEDSFLSAMKAATRLSDEERFTMGANGRSYVTNEYSWGKIGKEMASLYRDVLATSGSEL
jgi:glycosyltransferase involved in cell wall biosynthesis